ncbi:MULTISPECIES: histone-like nucleoid-structuring protein, MvaT/MvaU family [unclassified Pseudomonas]|uniref:histone-like nucleoid-structuring protein, MvaT/MvaU family n=1 Tax=unclassified Pseudomonas TaxID=196821 RepID=UPI0002A34D5F|nr:MULTISPECIES: histone-like nucleoid-structuring protein, MvaT/MvaU family [unclassified Pseudomonas]MBB1606064.1 transcriptional regulator [Pseudomonas sp. UMC76]MBB1636537.1 transcriptional regulator [Pseudomonas sp. UME83]NTX92722.1 transcriptional regulator [Pseudomonas sp. UMA643]NTY19918.1 transcriptional regulator [Pseudomonas sp. UMC3103]NTY27327.1 transcriptional regulator [Pseudomonas sp. UMA603]
MSKLAEFRAAEKALAEQIAYLESLKSDSALKKEIAFEGELKVLMQSCGKSLGDIISILDPESAGARGVRSKRATQAKRKERLVKVYKNPNTGEIVGTKGGNHRVLKAWKAEFGRDAVESWLQS